MVRCSNVGCNEVLPRTHLDEHEEICIYRRVACPHGAPSSVIFVFAVLSIFTYFSACGASVIMRDLDGHRSICLLALVRCSGCDAELKREQFPTHHASCPQVYRSPTLPFLL